jgi:hypothetical protein
MRNRVVLGILLLGAMGVPALAGLKTANPVLIDATARTAQGAIGTVRNTGDAVQYLGCEVTAFGDGGWITSCYARNAAGTTVSCVNLTEPQLRDSARALNGDSWLLFQWDDAGQCTQIFSRNDSRFRPK